MKTSKMSSFVDKSLMLKHLFHGEKMKLISAPRRFGKSTNLDMMKCFFSIPLNEDDATERLTTFKRLKINAEYPDFVNSNFGTYPVLYLDFFDTDTVRDYEDAVDIIADFVHYSYYKHRYLTSSMMLDDEDKEICTNWCGERSYRKMKPMEVQNGLINLARYLYTHYNNTKVFLLIDGYDSIIIDAIFNIEESETHLKDIVDLFIGQILQLVKSNKHVERAVITSVSPIASSDHLGLNSIVNYRFLRNHPYVDFYGFTETEVHYLFNKFHVSKVLAKEATQWYGGYVSKQGHRIFNPSSILYFLQKGRINNYWRHSRRVVRIQRAFGYPSIKDGITKMLRNESIKIEYFTDVSVNDMYLLKKMKGCDSIEQSVHIEDIFFSYLFEEGFLTFCKPEKQNYIRIPNLEMMDVFVSY